MISWIMRSIVTLVRGDFLEHVVLLDPVAGRLDQRAQQVLVVGCEVDARRHRHVAAHGVREERVNEDLVVLPHEERAGHVLLCARHGAAVGEVHKHARHVVGRA